MAPTTRKSTRSRIPTTKAKQNQETMKPNKPVLRSISTIDENENTYNNVNFKRRRISPPQEKVEVSDVESVMDSPSITQTIAYNTTIDDDDNEEDLAASISDDENIFNSDDDDYYSAISDYESDNSKSRFIMGKPTLKLSLDDELHSHIKLSQHHFLSGGDASLFDTDESESDAPTSPISSIMESFGELKSLEENFQRLTDDNQLPIDSCPLPSSPALEETPTFTSMTLEDCLNYGDQSSFIDETSQAHVATKQKFLQYRHDERHNLAFPDVSTFPIRYDPLVHNVSMKANGKTTRVRALNRRAILSGMASEMVATGMAIADFDMF